MPISSSSPENDHNLKRNAIGVAGIVFFVVAAAAPLAAALGASPVAFMALGPGAPAAYLLAGIVLLLFAVGYAAMSRYVTSSAGFAAYLDRGLGRFAGFLGGAVALLAYHCMLFALYGLLGFFTSSIVSGLTGVEWDWRIWTLIAWGGVAVLGYLEVNLSAKVLGVLMIAEVLIMVIFDVAVIAQGGSEGINFDGFAPANVFHDGLGVALLFAASCFVGFEATAIYGEEAKDPARTVPRATYAAVVLIAVFYALSTWATGLAHGNDSVQQAAAENPDNFVFTVNTLFVGAWATVMMNVLLVTSCFAVVLAFHNTLARYLFALGRSEVLPASLGRTHPRWQSPHRASIVVSVLTLAVVGGFMLADADPYAQLYSLLVGLGTLGVLVMQASTSVSVIVFFLRNKHTNTWWSGLIAPALGALGLFGAAALAVTNWSLLTGAESGFTTQLPWLIVVAAVIGAFWSVIARGKSVSGGPAPVPTPVPCDGPRD
ncbi:amino acid/polyamine/organocation transporter (APC superfamily) [Brevibacterium sanguinis]|uniref:Amino acid/polyamine/organocation transporter (APC superfamily) n=2 Tax=Brevibacterium TaxID=1696 RepID=A0A366INX7_9MICO|nr:MULTISPECIES: APC family permease [Brevibacterium]RBP67810.1 amino acid/polyamine/organocation transporter (APC superfamily) [Brevibacterium sanguinis]RBP74773.1 amino acid/polyamine/organocation transporter (APC superfamily) [Brevibacterium celere]